MSRLRLELLPLPCAELAQSGARSLAEEEPCPTVLLRPANTLQWTENLSKGLESAGHYGNSRGHMGRKEFGATAEENG